MRLVVEDPADPRLDDYRRLNDTAFRRRHEHQAGIFIAEGPEVIRRVLRSGVAVRSMLCLEGRTDRVEAPAGVTVFEVSRSVMERVVGFDLHRGVVASAARPDPVSMDVIGACPSLTILEGINDHANLGSILRAAAGLGVGGVILDPTCADPWYRRAVRVSMGTVASLPMLRSPRSEWPGMLGELDNRGFTVVALTPAADAARLGDHSPMTRPAVLLGSEGPGLSQAALRFASVRARIPMATGVDSLNVGQAAAVAFDRLIPSTSTRS